jgi:type IV secretion system protein VirD4
MRTISFLWALMRLILTRRLGRIFLLAAGIYLAVTCQMITIFLMAAALAIAGAAFSKAAGAGRRDSHGTARFANEQDLARHGLRGGKGLIIGRKAMLLLRFNRPGHLLTFAPTRSGKGAGCIIPNLLDHPGSAFVIDPKGENYAASHAWREQSGSVHLIAPFDRNGETARFNPLDFIRIGQAEEVDDAALIADMLVVPEHQETFWDSEAKALITMLILYVANFTIGRNRTLTNVWMLLMLDKAAFDELLGEIENTGHASLVTMARGFSQKEVRERSAVISTAQSHMKIWKSPLLAAATETSDFRMEEMKRQPTSIFLVIPPELLETYRPFVRLIVGLALIAMTRTVSQRRRQPVVFFLDEVAALGRMEPIEAGIGWLAGYGVTLWLFFQDLDQLMNIYRRWRSVIANAAVRQAFNVTDHATAAELSNMLGVTTIATQSYGRSTQGALRLLPTGFSLHHGEVARKLMTPDEIMAMPADRQLIFLQSCRPILARKIRWFDEQRFRMRKHRAERKSGSVD